MVQPLSKHCGPSYKFKQPHPICYLSTHYLSIPNAPFNLCSVITKRIILTNLPLKRAWCSAFNGKCWREISGPWLPEMFHMGLGRG